MGVEGGDAIAIISTASRQERMLGLLKPIIVLALTALIYAGLDPGFGVNEQTLVLVVSLIASLTLTTLFYEGGQVLVSSRGFGVPSTFRLYPVAIVIAAASVLVSRIADLHPGVIFGFVASAAILARGDVGAREKGLIVFVPMLGLLVTSLIALALIEPLEAIQGTGPWSHLPETVALAVFVGGAESLLLSVIPITFTDGEKLWQWNRLAWLALALPASFIFLHVIVNRRDAYGASLESGSVQALLVTCVVFVLAVAAARLCLRLRARLALD
jgi:hypothetical protein